MKRIVDSPAEFPSPLIISNNASTSCSSKIVPEIPDNLFHLVTPPEELFGIVVRNEDPPHLALDHWKNVTFQGGMPETLLQFAAAFQVLLRDIVPP